MSEKTRSHSRFKQLAILTLLLAASPACGEDEPQGAEVNCDLETRDDAYVANLEKAGTQVSVVLMESIPAPPRKDDNTWMIRIQDEAGAPLSGLSMVVTPWMPDHGHGTLDPPIVTELSEPGEYEVNPVDLRMPGLWEVTVEVADGTGLEDEVTFAFCVEG